MGKEKEVPAFAACGWGMQGDFMSQKGMSLRDWFAGMALLGFNTGASRQKYKDQVDSVEISSCIAQVCYEQADAMMEERKK